MSEKLGRVLLAYSGGLGQCSHLRCPSDLLKACLIHRHILHPSLAD
jgi:hypothetical protein